MIDLALVVAFAMIALAMALNVWTLWNRNSVPDRIVTLDKLFINSVALLVLYGIHQTTTAYYEAALIIAMLGFVSTVALCKFLLRGDIIE